MKPKTQKLTSTREYRPAKSINMERTHEFYGDQRMALSESPVRTTAGRLTAAMLREAGARLRANKEEK